MQENYDEILSEEEGKQLSSIMSDMFHSLNAVGNDDMREHLAGQFIDKIPDLLPEHAREYADEVCDTVERNDSYLADLRKAKGNGVSREAWFAQTLRGALAM